MFAGHFCRTFQLPNALASAHITSSTSPTPPPATHTGVANSPSTLSTASRPSEFRGPTEAVYGAARSHVDLGFILLVVGLRRVVVWAGEAA